MRRQVTWVALIAIVASLLVFASYRRNELDLLRTQIGTGRPEQRLAAVDTLVGREKLAEALQEQQPRWVQDSVVEAIARIGTPEAIFQLTGAIYLLDEPVAARATETIIRFDRLAIGPLVKALKDKDPNIRGGASAPLVAIGPAVIPALTPLMDAWDQYVRDGVVDVFGKIGAPVTKTCISTIQRIKPGPDETPQRFLWKRDTAVRALLAMKVPAIGPLIKELFPFKNDDVRALAAQALGQIADQTLPPPIIPAPDATRCIAPLLNLVNNDKAWTVRRKAASALGGVGKIPGQAVVPALVAHLGDPRPEVRAASAEALGRIGDASTAPAIVNMLMTNRAGAVREIVVALEKIGPGALPAAIPALSNPETEVREAATEAISVIGTAGAVVPLAGMLKDPQVSIRRTSSDALMSLADARVVTQLVAALADSDWHVYYAARDALAKVGPPAVPALVSALGSGNSRVAHMAEQALARIGKPAVSALVGDLAAQDAAARGWAAVALGDIGGDAVPALAAMISDATKPGYVRAAAANALGRTAAPGAMAPLTKAAGQPEPEVRAEVRRAMVRLGRPEATTVLAAGLTDPSPLVRATAMKLLIDWRQGDLPQLLGQILSSGDANARRRAAIVLAYQRGAAAHELMAVTVRGVSQQAKAPLDLGPTLVEAVTDLREDPEVRLYAVNSLGFVGNEQALPVLSNLLTPTDPLASPAARAIAMVGRRITESQAKVTEEIVVRRHPPSQAGQMLIDLLLGAKTPALRLDAAVALSMMADDPVFGLIDMFKQVDDDTMRLWVAATLGAIGKPASDACIDARSDAMANDPATDKPKDPLTRDWCTVTLQVEGDAQALDLVKHLPKEEQPDPATIAACQKILEQIRAARAVTD